MMVSSLSPTAVPLRPYFAMVICLPPPPFASPDAFEDAAPEEVEALELEPVELESPHPARAQMASPAAKPMSFRMVPFLIFRPRELHLAIRHQWIRGPWPTL